MASFKKWFGILFVLVALSCTLAPVPAFAQGGTSTASVSAAGAARRALQLLRRSA
jgi:hypothetical protein